MLEIEATVVPGFETMAKEEIIAKLKSEDVKLSRGHVNFYVTDDDLLNVLKLRSVDNLYFIVNRFENVLFSNVKDDCLMKICDLVYLVDWKLIVDTWQKFFTFNDQIDYLKILQTIKTSPITSQAATNFIQLKAGGGNADIITSIHDNINQDNIYNCELEIGKEKIESIVEPKTVTHVYNETLNVTKKTFAAVDNYNEHGDNNIIIGTDANDRVMNDTNESIITTEEVNDNDIKKHALKIKERNIGMPSYRVTCNRNGTHAFQSPMAACEFGGAINDVLKWNVDLENFDLEIMLIINGNEIKVGTGLTAKSLHRRDLIKFGRTSLRPTIAYGMLRMCRPLPGEIISDPMCGCGSIPIEASISYPECFHIAGDIDHLGIERTRENIFNVNRNRSLQNLSPLLIDVLNWDSGQLPFKDNTLDIFITDLPFGKRVGSRATNWQLYPHVLLELARVSKLGSGRVCLLTQDRKCIQHVMNKLSHLWKRGPTVVTNIGGLTAAVFMLFRTITPFIPNVTDT